MLYPLAPAKDPLSYPHVDESLVEEQHCLITDTLLQPTALSLTVKLDRKLMNRTVIGSTAAIINPRCACAGGLQ